MLPGYNTNGLAHHRPDEALAVIAAAGYRSVAITVDHHCFDPRSASIRQDVDRTRRLLEQYQLRCVIETGARYLLDPFRKHQPTLLTADPEQRRQRREFLTFCIDIAADLQADAVSFWSGTPLTTEPTAVFYQRLVEECRLLANVAASQGVRLAFEPEPGMFIETCDQFSRLAADVNSPNFGLTLDVGHVHCLQDGDVADRIREFAPLLWNIHLEDMHVGVHEHLPFGMGTIDFPPVFAALREIQYTGGVHVELSRESHRAPSAVRESMEFLRRYFPPPESR